MLWHWIVGILVTEIMLYLIPHCTSKCVGNHIFPTLLKYDDISHFFQLSSIYPVENKFL